MNRVEQHKYEADLAKAEAEEKALQFVQKQRAEYERKRFLEALANEQHSRETSVPAYYDYARAFDGPLRLNGGW